jgi:acyl carrier protein
MNKLQQNNSSIDAPEIFQTLLEITKVHVAASESALKGGNLVELGLDSMKTISLLLDLESRFNVTFADDQLSPENFQRISDIERTILTLLGARRS